MATYGKIRYPQTFNYPIFGLFPWTATDFKSECVILPDLGFILGNFNSNAFSITIRAVSWHMYKMIASMVCKQKAGF